MRFSKQPAAFAEINNKRVISPLIDRSDNNTNNREPETYKRHKPSKGIPLLSIFKNFISLHKSVTDKTQRTKLCAAFDNLLDLNDDLLLLTLENNVLNALIHGQRILLEDKSEQFDRKKNPIPIHAGRFEKHERRVTIVTSSHFDYEDVLSHELMHAAIGFTFSFDPLPVISRLNCINSQEVRDSIFVNAMIKFRQAPGFPYPAEETNSTYSSLNAAALKFKHCVRQDLHNYAEPTEHMAMDLDGRYPTLVADITGLMSLLKLMLKEQGSNVGTLQEILAYYMECRVDMLKTARERNIPIEKVYNLLAKALPNIHAYCETDFRKVLKYRLKYYIDYFYGQYYSEYLMRHDNPVLHGIKLSFCETGVLKYYRNNFGSQRSSEFSCSMFSHKAKARVELESARIATEADEDNNYCP